MVNITFEINGRRCDPRNIQNMLEAAVFEQVAKSIRERIGATRCPVHGQPPKIVVKGRDIKNLSFEVSGCCGDLIETVKGKFQ